LPGVWTFFSSAVYVYLLNIFSDYTCFLEIIRKQTLWMVQGIIDLKIIISSCFLVRSLFLLYTLCSSFGVWEWILWHCRGKK
jgi:hypothetical protein